MCRWKPNIENKCPKRLPRKALSCVGFFLVEAFCSFNAIGLAFLSVGRPRGTQTLSIAAPHLPQLSLLPGPGNWNLPVEGSCVSWV